jgi:hypothetical protein
MGRLLLGLSTACWMATPEACPSERASPRTAGLLRLAGPADAGGSSRLPGLNEGRSGPLESSRPPTHLLWAPPAPLPGLPADWHSPLT